MPTAWPRYEALAVFQEKDLLSLHEEAGRGLRRGKHRGTGIRIHAKVKRIVADLHKAAEEEQDPVDIIATIFDDIERDPQPFTDCNHRTALLLGRFVARAFGYNLKYSGPEGERLRLQWESMTRRTLRTWITAHLVAFEGR